jgi:hypothetical protein
LFFFLSFWRWAAMNGGKLFSDTAIYIRIVSLAAFPFGFVECGTINRTELCKYPLGIKQLRE